MNRIALLLMGIGAVIPVALLVGRPHPAAKPSLALEPAASAPRRAHSPAPPAATVYVVGAVRHAGLYTIASAGRVDAALRAAGGPSAQADLAAINLAEHIKDGEMIAVPAIGAAPRIRARSAPRTALRRPSVRARKEPPAAPVDLNAADATALAQLPGLGIALAERIVRFRQLNGPFQALDDLGDVAGMNQHRIDLLAPYLSLR